MMISPALLLTTGNALAALWLGIVLVDRLVRRPGPRGGGSHDGSALVLWGSYGVALLALNLHAGALGMPATVHYGGIALAAASLTTLLMCLLTGAGRHAPGRPGAVDLIHFAFWTGIAVAAGHLVALLTVLVAMTAALGVAHGGRRAVP